MKKEIIILAIIGLVYLMALNSNLSVGGDDTHYMILARSILSGQGYTDIQSPISSPHTTYPPFFSLILSFFIFLFGENILLLKFILILFMLGAIFLLLLIFRQDRDYKKKNYLLVVLIFGFNPMILSLSNTIISEAPYFLFSFLSLLWLVRYQEGVFVVDRYLWLTLIAMVASFYTRTAGIALLPTALFFLVYKRNLKKAILISMFYVFFISPWILRTVLSQSGYLKYLLSKDSLLIDSGTVSFAGLFFRAAHNFILYGGKVILEAFFYPHLSQITKDNSVFMPKVILSIFFSLGILYGYIIDIKKSLNPTHLYVLFFFFICLLWPVHGPRFIAPVFPFLILFLFFGIEALVKEKRYLIYIFTALILLPGLVGDGQEIKRIRTNFYAPEEKNYLAVLEWIKNNTSLKSKIMCRKPTVTFFYSGRKAMYYPLTYDMEKVIKIMEEYDIEYIILDVLGAQWSRFGMCDAEKFLKPVINQYPARFVLKFTTVQPKTCLYQFVRWKI